MLSRKVEARWLHCPIPEAEQHVSDFGRVASFDMALVSIEVEGGLIGWDEAKAAVGSAGACRALVAAIEYDLGPQLIGEDARQVNRLWDRMYNGTRFDFALARGRAFPVLGRRGLVVSAMSGIDMALLDLLAKSSDGPVVDLWGGPRMATLPAYASGGWAPADGIGDQVLGYVQHGFGAVKMRVGVMDGDVTTSVARVRAAREALGPDIGLMVDAHGRYSPSEAIDFAAAVAPSDFVGSRSLFLPMTASESSG